MTIRGLVGLPSSLLSIGADRVITPRLAFRLHCQHVLLPLDKNIVMNTLSAD